MNFTEAVKVCFNKYATFSGRADKAEFWWFFLFQVGVLFVSGMFGEILNGLVGLALLLPGLAVGARRLHDMGKSGWFQLLWLVPFIGWAILVYWLVQPTEGPNEFGHPHAASESTTMMPGQQ